MKNVEGIITAIATPLNEKEGIDKEHAEKLVEHVLGAGINGIIALGSTGEQISLLRETKKDLIRILRENMPDSVPMIVGAGAASTKNAIENCLDAQDGGADAVIVTPPCFYLYQDDDVVRYYEEIVEAIDIPIYLYNISRFTKIRLNAEIVKRLAPDKRIAGIKESDRDFELLLELLDIQKANPHFSVLQGSDRIILESLKAGCRAGVTVTSNFAPKLSVDLYRAFKDEKPEEAARLQELLLDYVKVITMFGKFPTELKTVLSFMDLSTKVMTSPFSSLGCDEEKMLRNEFDILIRSNSYV